MADSAIDLSAGLIPKEQAGQAQQPYGDDEIDISAGLIPKGQIDEVRPPDIYDGIDISAGLVPKWSLWQPQQPDVPDDIDLSAGLIPKEQIDPLAQPKIRDEIDISAGLIPKEPQHVAGFGVAQIPLFGRQEVPPPPPPPPPGVPPFAFDRARINKLTVEQVAGIVFNENRDVTPGESTPDQLQEAKTAQAHAVINADRIYGKKRQNMVRTAPWQVPDRLKNSTQYEQALTAARMAFQRDGVGIDPTAGRVYFNNRFEGQATGPRVYHGRPQEPYHTYGPFTVGGGKVWTVIYDDFKNTK
jgi:hypothetical protein